jgi:uncharacterized protein
MKTLTALSLTSGLAGHEVQCLGVIERLGLTPLIHHVKPSWLERKIAPFGKRNIDNIPKTDIIIAAGRQAVAYAKSLKNDNNIVVVLQDPRCSPKYFDLVWVNEHDKLTGENVIRSLTSPHRLTHEKLKEAAKSLPQFPKPHLGVIVGGASASHEFTIDDAREFAYKIKEAGKNHSIYLTPSRRTGKAQIKIIRDILDGFIWDGETGENPYFGILGTADMLIVTDDSTNMMSEAAFTGKPVYAYPIKGGGGKFAKFKAEMMAKGVIKPFDPVLSHFSYVPLDSTQIIATKIKTLIKSKYNVS